MFKNINLWPYGIIASIIACIIASAYTVIIALNNPVYIDNFYLEKYQQVDHNINNILDSQREFEKKINVKFVPGIVKISQNKDFKIFVNPISSLKKYELLLTRPDSNKFDKKLKAIKGDNFLLIKNLSFDKLGRWQLLLKLYDQKDIAFYKFEFFVNK